MSANKKQSWVDFYASRDPDRYLKHVQEKYDRFIYEVSKHIHAGARTMEAGCGPGFITKALFSKKGIIRTHFSAHLVDLSIDMLRMAKINLQPWRGAITFYAGDIRKPMTGSYDVVHSHGVLEHFCDDEIRKIISLQRSMSPVVIHYVPSSKYDAPSFGDERLMSEDQWHSICSPDKIIPFNDGHDLILTWGT